MKRNHYIFLGMALVALPSLAQVQPSGTEYSAERYDHEPHCRG